jgi:hypothetical protein
VPAPSLPVWTSRTPTLVRHLHDLHALREHYDPADVAALAREVMLSDAEAYGNQFPAYRENPLRETLRAVDGLAADPDYARRYAEFERLMVYGTEVEFAARVSTLKELVNRLADPMPGRELTCSQQDRCGVDGTCLYTLRRLS